MILAKWNSCRYAIFILVTSQSCAGYFTFSGTFGILSNWAKNFLDRMGGHMRNWRHNIFRLYVARINIQRHLPSSNNEQKMSSNHISSVCKWNMLSADFAASVHQVSHVSWSATSVVFRLHFIWIVTHSRSAWPLKFRQTRVSARFLRKIQMLGLCSFNMFKLTTC